MAYCGRMTPAALNSCSMTSCSTAPASRPHGLGQCGMTYPVSIMASRCAAASRPAAPDRRRCAPRRAAARPRAAGRWCRTRLVPARTRSVTSNAAASASTTASSAVARRRYRWASCSQVNPMPPCTWMLSCAHSSAAASASARAIAAASDSWSPPSSAARAASQTAAVASSAATSMLAQWCLTASNVAMGRPNCTRALA